ncbi:hypothetical protein [Mycolicibacterium goodii]|uniref:Uncharacterized protein n=1 Tax=Mycolicibacterium goodii TaxID=134601 RepID=A0ABS6HQ84_MYCGD|nr:hypothetical protein [Mycolicibacterium goodii]MBU8807375.1 hypothetical protein [Mycolicibacterium goodii]MBU8824781.1 hypothetical protein [Mycolicibacterium goodii]MBU8840281.1 hypothetical protein [Mycolicibacterium goodii]OKH75184.1 hypothetical protein EB74_30785 [Mycobacterium sp. SWH-M5]
MTGNQLLAQATMIPDYHQVRFASLGSRSVPELDDYPVQFIADESSIHVFTFADDQDEHGDRTVDVYVYRGTDSTGLGKLVFDAPLTFPLPELTFGSALETEDCRHHVPLKRTGSIRIRVLTRETQPGNGTDVINVLIDDS